MGKNWQRLDIRACCQLVVWSSSNLPVTKTIDYLQHGWELNEKGDVMPVTTFDTIAPEGLIELVSCKCKGDCTKGWCACKKGNTNCTDLCGCGDICLNTDALPTSVEDNENENNEDSSFSEIDDEDLEELDQFIQELENDDSE